MIKLKDGYAKLIGTTATGSANNVLLSNGGDKIIGNTSGNIPLNNGTLNVDLNADKLDGYDSSDFFRHEGMWSNTDDTKNVDSATGMLFVYEKHGVPEKYGTIATFKGKPQLNYYNLQLYGSASNKLFFRNWSPDLGLKDWVEVLSTGNYTLYLGYIGTTAVQVASAVQDLTGILNIDITANSSDRFITFKTTTTHFWRIGYLGSGTNNLLVFQSTKSGSETDGYYNALTFGCETLQATFSGNILVDRSVPIIQAKGTNGSVSLLVDSNRGLYDHVTSKWALGLTSSNNTHLNVGNVGIGTASPSEKLHVAGKVLATHFVKSGATDALILLGGGGHKAISSFYWADIPITTSATTNKKPTLSGIIFSGGSESFDNYGNFKFGASGTTWNVLKNDGTSLMKITASSGNMTVLGTVTAPTFIGNLNGDITKKTPQLGAATESNNINIVDNSDGAITNNYISNLSAIRKAILFRWYNTYWQIGNIRGSAFGTDGFGITYGSNTLCFRVTEAASYVYGNMYAVHFYESSDKRLKTNIQEILNSDKMPTIKEFDWKEDGSHSYGLIAQELEEQGYSELVSTKDNGYKTVNYSAALSLIVGKLLNKIKELEKEIEILKNKN